jgi:hypothetical protein
MAKISWSTAASNKIPSSPYLGICTTKTCLQNGVYITSLSCQIIHGDLVNNILPFFLLWVKYPDRLRLLIKSPPLSTVYLGICTTTQTFILYFTFRKILKKMKDYLVNNISSFFLLWVIYPGRLGFLTKSLPLYSYGFAQQKQTYKILHYVTFLSKNTQRS